MAKKKKEEYRALTGINFLGKNGEEVRVNKGDKFSDIGDSALESLMQDGKVEQWEPRHTENVQQDEGAVTGVVSTHSDGEIDVEGVSENA